MLQIRPKNNPHTQGKWISIKPATNNNLIDVKATFTKAGIKCDEGVDIRFIRGKKLIWQISAHFESLTTIHLPLNEDPPKQLSLPLKLFYFVNATLGPDKYEEILQAHLSYISASDACRAHNFKFTIVCVAEPDALKTILELSKKSLPHLFDTNQSNKSSAKFQLIALPHSVYERDCLRILWQDAMNSKQETIYCYAHAKGVTSKKTKGRKKVEAIFSSVILKRLTSCTHLLSTFPNASKVSGCFSPQGFAWHNFWLAKGSYLKELEEPPATPNRYFYEYWLSGIQPNDESISNGEIRENDTRLLQKPSNKNQAENIALITLPNQFNLGDTTTRKELNDYVLQQHEDMKRRAISGSWPV